MKFDSYHPAINFIFFTFALICAVSFDQPVYMALGYIASFVYSVKLGGVKALRFNTALILVILLYSLWYSYYNHFGNTVLTRNFIGNSITLEAVVYGIVLGIKAGVFIMWMSCFFKTVSSDKIIYIFGRVSPKLSLFISVILRAIPKIKQRAVLIASAQSAVGRGPKQGSILRRAKNSLRIISVLITWTCENFIESSDSMRSRGYTLKGRSAYSLYRFDARDRSFVIFIFSCITAVIMGVLLDQTHILYNPEIVLNRITPLSCVFYGAYFSLLLSPFVLQTAGEAKFKALKNKNI